LHGDVPGHDAGPGHDKIVSIKGETLLVCVGLDVSLWVVSCFRKAADVPSGTVSGPVIGTRIRFLAADEAEVLETSIADDVAATGRQGGELLAHWVWADLDILSLGQTV
jgi:hypothetical protein